MLDEEICRLRDKLNNSILAGEDYEIILKISIELDQLIAKHYEKERVC
ncbi:MAG: Spo0E family sporulation regulatory protein-aspartic acid phosphatase [Clostridia bacterium]